MKQKGPRIDATRRSLIESLADWEDQARWREFFETYWRLIYSVARKAGLRDAEAHDVVQETVLSVAKNVRQYDAKAGSFKNWLLQLTRWRIVDQLRKRGPADFRSAARDGTTRDTATLDRLPDPAGATLDAVWDGEWRKAVFDAAIERIKRKVKAGHFQIFDCVVLKQWPAERVAATLGVSTAQVYLVKHRISALLKKEIAAIEDRP
jgi:RNA polymerase sigma-70 factor (ECF subfamily)